MSRKVGAQRALAEPDPIYKSRLVTLLVRRIMKSGKKSLAQKIVYNALEVISNDRSVSHPLIIGIINDDFVFQYSLLSDLVISRAKPP